MAELRELGQRLHEDHFRILAAFGELENRIEGASAERALDCFDAGDSRLLTSLLETLDRLIVHHAFEEAVVFPRIADDGEGKLTSLLTREHGAIAAKARTLGLLGRRLLGRVAGTDEWVRFRHAAADLAAQVTRHLQNEEMTVLPQLSLLLDASTDHEFARGYGDGRTAVKNRGQGRGTATGMGDQPRSPPSRAAFTRAEAAARAARRRSITHPPRPRA